jgi:hypothetical protein
MRLLQSDDDFALGAPLLEIRKCFLGLLERKNLIDHWPDAPSVEKRTDFRKLTAVRSPEQE